MPGFSNNTVYAENVDFRGVQPVVPQMIADGQLLIGATASPHIRAATLTPGSGINIVNGPGSITISSIFSGTVKSVSVVSANGFAGTVANATTTPAITLSTSITGVLSGNGTAISGSSVTQHGVVLGGASNAVSSTAVGSTGTVLIGTTASDPSFSAFPQVSGLGVGASAGSTAGITFDGSNFMNNYAVGTWTPTIIGASTAGTTTYASQNGYYTRIGNLVNCYAFVQISGATGTGNVVLGGLPFTIKNQTNGYAIGSIYWGGAVGWTFPVGSTGLSILAPNNGTIANIYAQGSNVSGGNLQMANVAVTFAWSIFYQI